MSLVNIFLGVILNSQTDVTFMKLCERGQLSIPSVSGLRLGPPDTSRNKSIQNIS